MAVQQRRFRFGAIARGAADGAAWAQQARRAEALGYSTLLLPDHFGDQFAVIPALAAAAAATTTLRVGSMVIGNDFRHPAVLAKEAATIDVLSGGRLELGMGTGWANSDYDWIGMPLERAGIRIERMVESVEVMRGLFGPGPLAYAGKHYRIGGLEGFPKPVQPGGPPVLIGGGGRRVLSVAGRMADIVSVNPNVGTGVFDASAYATMTAAATDEKLAWVRAAAGRRFDEIEIAFLKFAIVPTDDRRAAAEQVSERFLMPPDEVLASPHAMIGSTAQIAETLIEQRERWHGSYLIVQAAMVEQLAPVVAKLAGT